MARGMCVLLMDALQALRSARQIFSLILIEENQAHHGSRRSAEKTMK